MNLNEIEAKCFIMALFIRDDGLRFLLGSGAYEFKDSQLMFAGNTIENDVVSVQGNDGYMLAGQVRRPNTQVFDGYIGDASVSKSEVEGYRRDFMAFFQKNHFYTVVYVMADGSAIQRRRGFLVDAPTSQELWQMYPEYHVALNFEDVNYYKYSENDDGEETYAKSADIGLAKVQYGGLIWDNDSEIEISGSGTNITLAGTMEGGAIESVELNGDTEQQTYSGKNLFKIGNSYTYAGITFTNNGDGTFNISGTATAQAEFSAVLPLAESGIVGGQSYTISSNVPIGYDTSSRISYYVHSCDSGGTWKKTLIGFTSAGTQTAQAPSTDYVKILVAVPNGRTVNLTNVKTQIEKGTTASEWEKYVGGTASPNPDYPQNVNVVTGEQSIEVRGSKNLFDKNAITSGYLVGRTDGVLAANVSYGASDFIRVQEGETYTFSSGFNYWYSAYYDSNKQYVGYPTNAATITIPSGVAYIRTSLLLTNLDTAQFEKGSAATTYEPYKGVTKTVNLGKNLFDKDNANTIAAYIQWTTPRVLNYSAGNSSVYIPCEPNTTYTISKVADNVFRAGSIEEAPATGITVYNAEENPAGTSITITTSAKAKYIVVFVRNTSSTNTLETILTSLQIEKGSTATTYAPYFTPIELCKIGTHQDYIYKSGDNWYVHKETKEFDLSTISYDGAGNGNFYNIGFGTVEGYNPSIPQLSNCFTYASTTWAGVGKFGIATGTGNLWLTITDASVQSEDAPAWLKNRGAIMYGVLRTPTDTQITNATLISELEDLLSATTYSGNTYITVSGDLASPLEVKAITIGGGGVVWDENGAEWEAGGGGEIVIVNVDSIENILPVWTIRGEAENPTLTNLTTGMSITYNGTVASGQTLVIDLLNKTAKLNGTSVISDISGQWVEFKPGNNRVSYSTENANAPDSTIEWQEVVG